MADYIVKDTELTSVANAIRTAGGTNSLLSFPNGFVSAVNNISGGGSLDFSTTQVTVNVNAGNGTIIYPTVGDTVYLDDETDDPITVSDVAYYNKASVSNAMLINILTYKGKAVIYTDGIYDIENGIASQRLYDEVLDQSCFTLSNVSNATIITIEGRE